jgi:hypothetical protein
VDDSSQQTGGTRLATPLAETIRETYPVPLAAAYGRADAATMPAARYAALRALAEASLHYLASGGVGQYRQRRGQDAVVNGRLAALRRRPDTATWNACLQAVTDWWRLKGGSRDQFVFPELLGLCLTPTRELPRTARFLSLARGRQQDYASLSELFDWLAETQPSEPPGDPPLSADGIAAFAAALDEILASLPSLAWRTLVRVEAAQKAARGQTTVRYRRLMGRVADEAAETHTVAVPGGALHPEQLYLCYPDAPTPGISLHPLLIGAQCPVDGTLQVFAPVAVVESGLEYWSPGCGHRYRPVAAGGELAGVLRVLRWRTWQGRMTLAALVLGLGALVALLWPAAPKYPTDGWGPAWTPNGKQIFFSSSRDGKAQIYRMNADGSGQTRITHDGNNDLSPAVSPDGRQIAFISDRNDSTTELYMMNADGSNQQQILNLRAADPAWSPDGRRLACSAYHDGTMELLLMNPDGSDPTFLTNAGTDVSQPAWSPDGRELTFRRGGFSFARTLTRGSSVNIVPVGGGPAQTLVSTSLGEMDAAWAPGGRQIAFRSFRVGAHGDIYVANADGSDPVRLTTAPGEDSYPAWSPDGRQIAFTTDRDGPLEIYLMNPDGSNQRPLTRP